LEVVFTTSLGFRDLVDFRIDAQAQRIDYRSRSSFELFDFGKNRSRMSAFSARFDSGISVYGTVRYRQKYRFLNGVSC